MRLGQRVVDRLRSRNVSEDGHVVEQLERLRGNEHAEIEVGEPAGKEPRARQGVQDCQPGQHEEPEEGHERVREEEVLLRVVVARVPSVLRHLCVCL